MTMRTRRPLIPLLAVTALVSLYRPSISAQSWLMNAGDSMHYGDSKCSGTGDYCIQIVQDYLPNGYGWVLAMNHYYVGSGGGPHQWLSDWDTSFITGNALGHHEDYYEGVDINGHFDMQGDGNLVLYDEFGNSGWSTTTNGNDGAYLNVQDDGNLVVYSAGNSPIWSIWA